MRRSLPLLALVTALAVPAAAAAQGPVSGAAQLTKPRPVAPKPASGKMSIQVRGGQPTKKLRYVVKGARVVVAGRSQPFVPGQVAVLAIVKRGRVVATRRAQIRQAGSAGRVNFSFKARRRGMVKLFIRHAATSTQSAFRSRAARMKIISPQAGQGARGIHVLLLQRGLRQLGFAVPVTGLYDGGTSRAVLAFRKTNGMGRTGFASRHVFSLVLRGRGAFRPRYPKAGRHVEFDWSRQVLALIDRGRARRVYHASSGKPSTPTVFGTFRFYRKQPGTNSHGMVQSNYFIGGYAIHGYASVPAYAASHGCIRVPIPNAYDIDRQISLGETIFVYR
jgi:L,D-transpeptidase catalytic domain